MLSRKEATMYLIQGVFCQQCRGLAIGLVAGEGAVPLIQEGFAQVMFAGKILLQNFDGGKNVLSGETQDIFGHAKLSDISFSPEGELRFVKQYCESGSDSAVYEPGITYVLHRELNGTWVGEYTVPEPDGLKGPVRCIITKVDHELFANDLERFVAENTLSERESSP